MIQLIASQSSSVARLVWAGDAKVKIYGSRAVGLALPESDIDVALLPSTPLSEAQQQRALALLGEALQESGGWATGRVISCHAVTVTAIPVLKVHEQTVSKGVGVETSVQSRECAVRKQGSG